MIMWKVALVMIVTEVSGNGAKHNEEHHGTLCEVLKAVTAKWGEVKERDSSDPLKKALHKTIFGNMSATEKVSELKFPKDYYPSVTEEKVEPNSRKYWCGLCGRPGQKHYPGESATHDLVCLCTPGEFGHPVNGGGEKKLCGQSQGTWGADKKGWHTELFNDNEKERKHLSETWNKIIKDCLQSGNGDDLDTALKKFTDKLRSLNGNQYLGDHSDTSDCSGTAYGGVCVKYPLECVKNSWWKELEKATRKAKENRQNKDKEKIISESSEKGQKWKTLKGQQKTSEKTVQTPQPTPGVALLPKTEEAHNPQTVEKLLANISATHDENSSPIIKPHWFLMAALLS
ncbi:Variant surface glycoprotein [Trypanosoma congolense IL3000]|uniref:Variant surface glycoprotein n=1 Tax=Trypanosoma congolense (strain IL3000) TaxID=1068625 RepID=F9WIV3_TRYCI|nr:Variant surface glycoprotein [Trypanosoma congolense IL3000]